MIKNKVNLFKNFITFIVCDSVCVYVCVYVKDCACTQVQKHMYGVVAREQLAGVSSLLPDGPRDPTQVIRLFSKLPYPLSHLAGPKPIY